ncbi:MAG: leucine--tRNA ligase [Planctomycetes bacterium]|nr:leucine--tRNA ligase [Planctomycetota bacterium]
MTATGSAPSSTAADGKTPHRYTAALATEIELRWQGQWESTGRFQTPGPGDAGFDASRPKYYCLDMFPYPSGTGLHVGHPEGYTATDIICRYRRLRGYNVLHPMGWDAFGLPAEQYAIKTGIHPAITTQNAIETFRRQLKRFGFSYDWSREFATIDPDYYRWTQWIWLKAYDAWYDADQRRARPIAELVDEFRSGARPIRFDPDRPTGFQVTGDEHDRTYDDWDAIDARTRKRIVDTYRLAYLSTQTVNWCPKLGTALANEEVIGGRSERGSFPVHRKPLKQWMFRITAYADRLLVGLEGLNWPESTLTMQREWIGRSEGAEIDFKLAEHPAGTPEFIRVYTTRPDTVFGATYMVLAPEHPLVEAMLAEPRPGTDVDRIASYVRAAVDRADIERMSESKEKTGVPTGYDAVNPATGERIPIWIADYVLMGYGHGAIMAVPAGDERDFEFAKTFDLDIVPVVEPTGDDAAGHDPTTAAWVGPGRAINSANAEVSLDGLDVDAAKQRIIEWFETNGHGRARVNYRLRDWLFSRQRYWGEPFPIVYDEQGDHYPVSPDHLPVVLPEMEDYHPVESDEPAPLLAKATEWIETTAGEAGVAPDVLPPDARVRREANTMPGWAGSCWYYLRFCAPADAERFVSEAAEHYWMGPADDPVGVDLYIGGAEHAVLHLLYARFWHQMLYDLGDVSTPEPVKRLFHQGMITSHAYQRGDGSLAPVDEVDETPDGAFVEQATGEPVTQVVAKMSKALKNVVNPDDVIAEFGADTFRLYEMYMGPLEQSKPWNTRDMGGLFRFLQRAWRLFVDEQTGAGTGRFVPRAEVTETDALTEIDRTLHRTIAGVTQDVEKIRLNTAIAKLIELNNALVAHDGPIPVDIAARFLVLLSPFAPHITEELWSRLGDGAMADATWPEHDEAMLSAETVELPVQIQGRVRARITVPADADEATVRETALADERIAALLEGKTVRKVIVVPGKIVNVIAG